MGRDASDLRQGVGDRAQQRQGSLQTGASAFRPARLRPGYPGFGQGQGNRTKRQRSCFRTGQSQESSITIQRERKKYLLKDVQVKSLKQCFSIICFEVNIPKFLHPKEIIIVIS